MSHFSFLSSFGLFSDTNLWFPLSPSAPEPVPTCASGHSATYDPDSKSVFVYGGLREGQRYSDLYILDTRTWRWRLVNVGLCKSTSVFYIYQQVKKMFLPTYRLGAIYPNWPTTLQPFIRRSFLSLVEFSRAILPETNPVVMLCTSLTQSMSSGISPSWRGTDLCHVLGQSFQRSQNPLIKNAFFELNFLFLFCMEKPLSHADAAEVGDFWWTEDGHLLKRSPHSRLG